MFDPRIQGHTAIRQRLLERVQAGTLPGSLLFTGPDGIGKRRVAMELAQRELCFRKSACGHCPGCDPFHGRELPLEWPNLLRIAPEGKAGLIRIATIREDALVEGGVLRWVHQAPAPGCCRWILVEDAHRLNGPSANMLLKTLEEPPAGVHFLLVTHRPEAMLQTIRSRCERISFSALGPEEAWAVASAKGWEEKDRERWTALAAGTLKYLELEAFERASAKLEAWLALGRGAAFHAAAAPLLPDKDRSEAQGEQVAQGLDLLLLVLGDVGRLREGRPLRLAPWASEVEGIARGALQLKRPQELVFEAQRHLIRNPSFEALLREVAMSLRT